MPVTDPSVAKRFRASTFAGTHQAQVNAAITAANTYVANNPAAADLFDDSAALYTLQNTDAKAAGAKAGPNGLQAIAEDDVGGLMQASGTSFCLTMKDNVRLEFSKDCSIAQGTSVLTNFVNVNGCDNFTVTTKPGSLATARSGFGTNIKHPEWSAGKAVIDLRGHTPGSGSGLNLENIRMSEMLGSSGGGATHFKYQNLFLLGNNDCAAPGYKQDTSFFTPRGAGIASAAANGIWIDLDMDGCYSGFGGHQISAVYRCLYANGRSHGGTMWRNESDGHFPGGSPNFASYGVNQCDFIAGYGEDMNKVLTMQPNNSVNFQSWYVDGIYGISCLEVANTGQFTGPAATQNFARSFWGEIWHLTGEHSAWQEQAPCMVNDSVAVYAQSGGPLPGSVWQSMKYNLGKRGGAGAGADGGGADIPFAARADGTHTNGARDTTITATSLRNRWASKKVVLGAGAVTTPGQPTLSGPPSPQTTPYTLVMTASSDKSSNWEWRLTTGGVAGAWTPGTQNTASDTKSYPGLTTNTYLVEARCTNSAGTSLVSSPFSFVVNAGGGAPTKAVISSGPPSPTTLSTATFAFSAAGSTSLQTSVDGAAFSTTTSPQSLTGMAVGTHNFRVQGVNASGTGAISDPYVWQVTSTQPVSAISAVILTGTSIVDKPGEWAATNTTLLDIPFPGSISVGDFLLLVVGWGATSGIGVPTGWTALANSPVVAGSSLSLLVAQRVYTGQEGSSVTVSGPNANGGSGIILAISGAYSTQPVAGTSISSSG